MLHCTSPCKYSAVLQSPAKFFGAILSRVRKRFYMPPVTHRIDPPPAGLCLPQFSHGFKRLRGVLEVARLGGPQLGRQFLMARMPSSRPRGGRVIVLLMAALPWKASCMNQQHTDQSSHHLEGNLSLLPSIAHLLVRTAVDLCSRMPLLAFSFGRAALHLGAVPMPHRRGVLYAHCNVWMQTARR